MIFIKNRQRKKIIIFFLILLKLKIIGYSSLFATLDISEKSIKVGFYCDKIKFGGVERVVSLLINLLSNETNFTLYLITNKGLLEGEYTIPKTQKEYSYMKILGFCLKK